VLSQKKRFNNSGNLKHYNILVEVTCEDTFVPPESAVARSQRWPPFPFPIHQALGQQREDLSTFAASCVSDFKSSNKGKQTKPRDHGAHLMTGPRAPILHPKT
jgi:hypothetical protein